MGFNTKEAPTWAAAPRRVGAPGTCCLPFPPLRAPFASPGPTFVHSRRTCGKGHPCGKSPRPQWSPRLLGSWAPPSSPSAWESSESSRKGELLPKPTSHQGSNRRLLGGHLSPADTRVQLKNLPLGCPNAGDELFQIHAPTDSRPCCLQCLGPHLPGLSRLHNKPPEARVRD